MKSELCTYELASGDVTVVLSTDRHIEAPNWTPDGKALIVNGGGEILRFDLESGDLEPVFTGFADRCNNDHGVSPDGSMLVISDSAEMGKSAIYTLPVTGGEPRRVSRNVPSYWHGWSPDGARLAYVGNRGDGFQVFTIPTEGGPEFQVTHDFDHCDGPDYTPDGAWIWFNGERGGCADLWRIRPDGSDLEQMTDDDNHNWFPHPSPDGEHVLYMAYPPGTSGHPFGLDVVLRLLPPEGGAPRDLVELWGGQGTINVPCWAPDSRAFAFMRFVK